MAHPAIAVLPEPRPRLRLLPRDAYQEFHQRKVFGSLDGLRALSILGVIWHHASRGRGFFSTEGALGVPLFFAISGFLITTLLLRERDRHGRISLSAFYARRSLRIFPLYYAVVALYTVLVLVTERGTAEGQAFLGHLPAFLTYTSNWFVPLPQHGERVIFYFAWSLATEEQFYLVWPSVERFLGRRPWVPVALAGAMVAAWSAVALGLVTLALPPLARTILLSVAPAICMGVILAHALHAPAVFERLGRTLGHAWVSSLLLVAVVGALLAGHSPLGHLASYALMTLLVGACCVREDHLLARVLKSPVLVSLGKVSYGLYLFHVLCLNVVERAFAAAGLGSRGAIFLATVLISWGVASLSFRHFEQRWLALKTRFAR